MKYISLKDLRAYLQFYPIRVSGETPDGAADGANKTFYAKNKPIVDFDYDGEVMDDVVVKVNGAIAEVASIDPERGEIILVSPPPENAAITIDYFWHPFGDWELKNAIAAAEAEIDGECGRSFEAKITEDVVVLTRGNQFHVSRPPIISIEFIRVEDVFGEPVKTLSEAEYDCDPESGRITLKKIYAGLPVAPWYILSTYYIRVRYVSGYQVIPEIVKQATTILAAYHVLNKINALLTAEPEYQGKIAVVFKSPRELTERLAFLREEIERLKRMLPRAMGVA